MQRKRRNSGSSSSSGVHNPIPVKGAKCRRLLFSDDSDNEDGKLPKFRDDYDDADGAGGSGVNTKKSEVNKEKEVILFSNKYSQKFIFFFV